VSSKAKSLSIFSGEIQPSLALEKFSWSSLAYYFHRSISNLSFSRKKTICETSDGQI